MAKVAWRWPASIIPGLILLDLHLPGMDGFAVLQALKEDEATADIPVIAMTGSPELKDDSPGACAGAGRLRFHRQAVRPRTCSSRKIGCFWAAQ